MNFLEFSLLTQGSQTDVLVHHICSKDIINIIDLPPKSEIVVPFCTVLAINTTF